jgi:hypothetical protein
MSCSKRLSAISRYKKLSVWAARELHLFVARSAVMISAEAGVTNTLLLEAALENTYVKQRVCRAVPGFEEPSR